MKKTEVKVGTKIRCIDSGGFYFLTTGKTYDVLRTTDEGFEYLDDEGDELFYCIDGSEKEKFEIVPESGIKIGDFVKLKEWEEFLEVIDVNNVSDSVHVVEEDEDGSKYYGWYPISLGFIKQGDEDMQESNAVVNAVNQKQDEFQVGDVVYCVMHGKGKVQSINSGGDGLNDEYPVQVNYDSGDYNYYTLDGRFDISGVRCLFFSEPKIEAAVTRPFVSTLVGKRVVVVPVGGSPSLQIVFKEDSERIYVSEDGAYWYKVDLEEVYEVQSENLLKK